MSSYAAAIVEMTLVSMSVKERNCMTNPQEVERVESGLYGRPISNNIRFSGVRLITTQRRPLTIVKCSANDRHRCGRRTETVGAMPGLPGPRLGLPRILEHSRFLIFTPPPPGAVRCIVFGETLIA